jgi:hypothetical protein
MKHKVRIIPKEEILANRSNAYEFIDFDKQETLEEAAEKLYKKECKHIWIRSSDSFDLKPYCEKCGIDYEEQL